MKLKSKWAPVAMAGVVLIPVVCPPNLSAGPFPYPPASEMTQILNGVKLLQSLLREAQMVQANLAEVQNMVYNTKQIGSHPMTAIMNDLNSLDSVLIRSQGLAYGLGQMSQQFAQMYPQYSGKTQWLTTYSNWSGNTLHTVQGTLETIGVQGQLLQNEQQTMQQLRMMAQSPLGQNQAIQAGALVAVEEVNQLQKLRQLMMVDMQEKAAFAGQQMQTQNAQQKAQNGAFQTNTWGADQRGY